MKSDLSSTRLLRLFIGLIVSAAWTHAALGGSTQQSLITVQDILDQELKHAAPSARSSASSTEPVLPKLIGIWGVYPKLYAQVSDRGRIVEFQRGRAPALAPYQRQYSLLTLKPPCIRIKIRQRKMKVCL